MAGGGGLVILDGLVTLVVIVILVGFDTNVDRLTPVGFVGNDVGETNELVGLGRTSSRSGQTLGCGHCGHVSGQVVVRGQFGHL